MTFNKWVSLYEGLLCRIPSFKVAGLSYSKRVKQLTKLRRQYPQYYERYCLRQFYNFVGVDYE